VEKTYSPLFPSALASCPSPRRPSVGRWSLAACPCPPVGAWPSELGKTSIHATPELARPPEVHSRPPKLEQPPSSIRGPLEVARPLEVDSWHLELTQPPELGRGSNRATPELALPLEVDSRPPARMAAGGRFAGPRRSRSRLELVWLSIRVAGAHWSATKRIVLGSRSGGSGSTRERGAERAEPTASAAKRALACNVIHPRKAMSSTNKTLYSKIYRSNQIVSRCYFSNSNVYAFIEDPEN
jgi:hypothetical protein